MAVKEIMFGSVAVVINIVITVCHCCNVNVIMDSD